MAEHSPDDTAPSPNAVNPGGTAGDASGQAQPINPTVAADADPSPQDPQGVGALPQEEPAVPPVTPPAPPSTRDAMIYLSGLVEEPGSKSVEAMARLAAAAFDRNATTAAAEFFVLSGEELA